MTALKKYVSKAAWWLLTLVMTALVATAAFVFGKRLVNKKLAGNVPQPVATNFDSRDAVSFMPVPNKVFDTTSDMTVNAVLDGGFGPAVVMVYAEWCVHCRNMMPAFEAAAAKANVPFVRVQGQLTPVVSQKHKIFGYPTVLGVNSSGVVVRFAEERSEQKLLEFAAGLGGAPLLSVPSGAIPSVIPVAPQIVTAEPSSSNP